MPFLSYMNINLRSIIYYTWLICIHKLSIAFFSSFFKIIVLENIGYEKNGSPLFLRVLLLCGKWWRQLQLIFCQCFFLYERSNGPYFFSVFTDRDATQRETRKIKKNDSIFLFIQFCACILEEKIFNCFLAHIIRKFISLFALATL